METVKELTDRTMLSIPSRKRKITWVHLSDWHQTSPENLEQTGVAGAIASDIARMREKSNLEHIDFIVFSGDIAHAATDEEYGLAASGFLEALVLASFKQEGRDTGEVGHQEYIAARRKRDVFVVPGNHDLNRDAIQAFTPDAADLSKNLWDTAILKKWQEDDTISSRLLKPFEAYGKFADNFVTRKADAPGEMWKRTTFPDHSFVDTRDTNGVEVTICGFNSALFCGRARADGKVNDYGSLFIGPKARARVLEGVSDKGLYPKTVDDRPHLRIAILHHPFAWLTHGDRSETRTEFLNKFDFILMGH